ncbi:MAG: V-type ATP synthase subunit I [Gemmatimonadota bacterium]|nr:MAG: V-type ATP synthase subunit I [Gemmatimonadota bacterium]
MSIVRLKRLTLYGMASEKDTVLEGLQQLGCMHLVDLRQSERRVAMPSAQPKDTYEALRHLEDSPVRRRPASEDEDYDLDAIVEKALWNRQRRRSVHDRLDELKQQIREVEPWGNFRLPEPRELGGMRLWFYVVPLHQMNRVRQSDLTWQVVRKDHRNAYVVVVSKQQPTADAMPVPPVDLGRLSLAELRWQEELAQAEREEVFAERWALTRWLGLLKRDMARAENRAALEHAGTQTFDSAEIFAVQGWVPQRRAKEVLGFAERRGLACTLDDPKPDESPPVLLDNPTLLSAGEDLVAFFQLPGYRDWDPSIVVFVSFALFFAMILSDAGYAAVLAAVLAFMWKRMGRSAGGRRMRSLAGSIVGASVVYGVLVGSYFGLAPAEGSLLGSLKILEINDFDAMMKLSVVVGGTHVALANLMVVWNRRDSTSALAPVGWITIVASGLGLMLLGLDSGFATAAWWAMGAGGACIVLFSSERQLRRVTDMMWRLLDGLKAAMGLSGAFGDVLSYLRLFALGLSSASLAVTFNRLAVQAMDTPGIGLLFGLAILLLGHVLNVILAIISGVVHGLRLNLIEFYNWGVSGEGDTFRAFCKKETLSWTQ